MSVRSSPWFRRTRRRGTALLEVMVSLAVLGLSGTALISVMGQSAQSLQQVRRTELQVRHASDELGRFVGYDRAQLIASIGQSVSHDWLVSVVPSGPDLFDVVIADTIAKAPIVRTTLYRPDTLDARTP